MSSGERIDNGFGGVDSAKTAAVPLRFGGGAPRPRFDGTLDEIAIYDKKLSPDRIKAHYRMGRGMK